MGGRRAAVRLKPPAGAGAHHCPAVCWRVGSARRRFARRGWRVGSVRKRFARRGGPLVVRPVVEKADAPMGLDRGPYPEVHPTAVDRGPPVGSEAPDRGRGPACPASALACWQRPPAICQARRATGGSTSGGEGRCTDGVGQRSRPPAGIGAQDVQRVAGLLAASAGGCKAWCATGGRTSGGETSRGFGLSPRQGPGPSIGRRFAGVLAASAGGLRGHWWFDQWWWWRAGLRSKPLEVGAGGAQHRAWGRIPSGAGAAALALSLSLSLSRCLYLLVFRGRRSCG